MHGHRILNAALFTVFVASGCTTVEKETTGFHMPEGTSHSYVDTQLEKYSRQVEEYPKRADLFYGIAAIHFQKQDYRESAAALGRAIELDPDQSRYHYHLGRVYMNMREMEKAEDSFRQAVELAPEDRYSGPRAALAYVYALKKDLPEATKQFEKCLAVDPEVAEYYYFLGALHDMQGDRNDAIRCFREYLQRGGTRYRKKTVFLLGKLGVQVDERYTDVGPDPRPPAAPSEELRDLPDGIRDNLSEFAPKKKKP